MKKFEIGGITLKNRFIQAPLAGFTSKAMRKLAYECGASLTYTEMISATAIYYKNKKTIEMLPSKKEDGLLALQLFGGEIDKVKYAIEKIESLAEYDFLDFNLGCPVPKVLKQHAGSFWLYREDELYELFKTMVDYSHHPVIIKSRIGYDNNHINILDVIKIAHSAGIKAVAIHGRTRAQMYSGNVNYDIINEAKNLQLLPIIANGDIGLNNFSNLDSKYNFDAYMIGREAIGNPLLFQNLCDLEEGKNINKTDLNDQIDLMKKHMFYLIEEYGENRAISVFRGIAPFYIRGFNYAAMFRSNLVKMKSLSDFNDIVKDLVMQNND